MAIPATVNRQTAPRVRLLLLNIGALICALALLMGRWSPARLFDDQTWDDVPWYLDLRPVLVVFGLLIIASIRDSRRPALPAPRQLGGSVGFIVALLVIWTLTSGIGGIDCHSAYCSQKTFDVVWLACFVFITYGLAQEPRFEELFYRWVFVLCMTLALLGLRSALQAIDPGATGLTVLEGGRNVYSRLLFVLCILAVAYYFAATQPAHRLFFLGVIVLSLGLVLLTGSRGGTVAGLCGLATAMFLFRVPVRHILLITCGFGVALALVVEARIFDVFAGYVIDRYIDRIFESFYWSSRDTLLLDSLAEWRDYPLLGTGLGRFSELNTWSYPHNVFLELLTETGVVGTLLLLVPLAFILASIRRYWSYVDKRGVAIWTAYLVAAQVSGDLYDSRALILIPVIAACAAAARSDRVSTTGTRGLLRGGGSAETP